jgi:hypothetical protein
MPIHHLTPDQHEKDADNRAALLRAYPHYAPTAPFLVVLSEVWYQGNKYLHRDSTVVIISFAEERAKDPPISEQRPTLWGQVD